MPPIIQDCATGCGLEYRGHPQAYLAHPHASIHEALKLNRPDVGWYQVRKALEAQNESGDYPPVSFALFAEAYKALTEKLQPMVYELGFLRA